MCRMLHLWKGLILLLVLFINKQLGISLFTKCVYNLNRSVSESTKGFVHKTETSVQ